MLLLPIGERDIQKMPFTPSKPSAQSVKGIFFYNDSTRFEKSYLSCSRINYKYLKTNRIEIKM